MVSAPESVPRWARLLSLAVTAAVLGLGAWLRAITWPWHDNLWAIDWLSYYEPQAEALSSLRLWAWAGSWEGLHPPFSGVVHGTLMAFGVPLLGHWVATTLAGLAAIALLAWALAREHGAVWLPVAFALWAAASPLQANYGLNTSPYPWTLLLVAGAVLALSEATRGESLRHWTGAAVLAGLAVQAHVLAFAVVIAQALWLGLRGPVWWKAHAAQLKRWGLIVGLFCAPMIVGSLTKTSDPWTFHIEEGAEPWVRTAWMVLHERFGGRPTGVALGGALALGALVGAALRPRGLTSLLIISVLGWCAALTLFIEIGVADPRLSHYYLVPQLLGLAAGASGLAALLARVPRAGWVVAPLIGLLSLVWGEEALRTQLGRRADAVRELAHGAETREVVRAAFADAGDGDVVAYLWNHEFLNDEPEYMDPYAGWPLTRVGRRCREEHPPRGLCNAAGAARFYFDPSAFAGPLYELEEPLRLMVNQASAPGRARIFLLPGPNGPARPFPSEVWMRSKGGTERRLPGGVSLWEFPAGARIAPPRVPLPRPEEPSEDSSPE